MALFINKDGILKHFDRLFKSAKKEIIMIVPYIKLNDEIFEKLKDAEKRNIEILIVYRENQLSELERNKLFQFQNITILYHPNVHSKCYLNEYSMIICSMNLYDNSIKNNREMGVVFDLFQEDVENSSFLQDDDDNIKNALIEVITILNASTIQKKSQYVNDNGFVFNILKTDLEIKQEYVNRIKNLFDNKKIFIDDDLDIICTNFYENVDLLLEVDIVISKEFGKVANIRRICLYLNHNESQIKEIFEKLGQKIKKNEYLYKYYKCYWTQNDKSIKLYRDKDNFFDIWDKGTEVDFVKGLMKGVHLILQDLRKIPDFNKK